MKREEVKAIKFTADDGKIFINRITKVEKKVLIFQNEKWFTDYKEVTISEAAELNHRWNGERYKYLKTIFGN
jgi:hypothetical protein